MDFEVQNFVDEVLDASHEQPVLVDFWAPWCGPCRVLSPVLEKLATEDGAAWKLVKVNTDVHQDLAAQYRIRGIPAVKLFVDGDVVDEFTGALPEYAIRQWLEKAIPTENKKRLERAQAELAAGHDDAAEQLLRQVLDEEPNNAAARVLLARLIVFDEPEQALALVDGAAFAGPAFVQIEEAVRTFAQLVPLARNPEQLPDEPGRDDFRQALAAFAEHDYDTAVRHFIDVIQKNRYYDDDAARKACIALFNLLGDDHPTTRTYRRRFDMSLY